MPIHIEPDSIPARALLLSGSILLCVALSAVLGVESSRAGAETLNESFHLHLTKVKGNTIDAQGRGTGTITGNATIDLTLVTASRANASFHGSNASGSITGIGAGSYHVAGAMSYFTGSITSVHGSGRYARVSNISIKLNGSVNRRTDEMSMTMRGDWHE